MNIELTWDDKRKKWRGPGGKLRRGPWGLYDAETNTWVGNDSGPVTYTDEIIARVSAELIDIVLGQQPGRTKHRRLPGGPWRLRETVKTKMTTFEALKGKEEGRFI